MNKLGILIQKEWADVFRNRYVSMLVIILPAIMIGMPILVLAFSANPAMISGMSSDIPPQIANSLAYAGLEVTEQMQAFVGQQFNIFFLIMPLAIPMTIATYSIIGEKRDRSLEPLLATPIRTTELLTGKAIAAATPGILTVLLSAIIYVVALQFIVSTEVRAIILAPSFFIMVGLVAPLLTVLATTVGLMVSSRVNDPRAAEQMGMVVLLPIIGLMLGQIAGFLTIDAATTSMIAMIVFAADVVLIWLAVKLFSRETILTKWK